MRPIIEYIKDPSHAILGVIHKTNFLYPDAFYLKMLFKLRMGEKLDLKNPKSFNQKLQWLKLYNHNPAYTKMVDKYAVKEYVASKLGEQYIIPTIGVWETPEQIEWNKLPKQFVLKTTHGGGGGGVAICKNINSFDKNKALQTLSVSMKSDIYKNLREWPYKGVKKQIIAEELLVPEDGDLKDYKVLCFNGKPKLIEFHSGRFTDSHTQDFYDTDWHKMPITQNGYGETSPTIAPKPELLEKMLGLCEILAAGMPHVRIDWYYCNGKLYFGEITFFDGSGFEKFDNYNDDLLLGSWIDLNLAYNNK